MALLQQFRTWGVPGAASSGLPERGFATIVQPEGNTDEDETADQRGTGSSNPHQVPLSAGATSSSGTRNGEEAQAPPNGDSSRDTPPNEFHLPKQNSTIAGQPFAPLISALPLHALASLSSTSSPMLPSLHQLSSMSASSPRLVPTPKPPSPPKVASPSSTDSSPTMPRFVDVTSEAGAKRKRDAAIGETRQERHNLAEQKRRNQMRKGFDQLQALLPQGAERKMTKVALIDEAIEYITQLQAMSHKLVSENAQLREEMRQLQLQFGPSMVHPAPYPAYATIPARFPQAIDPATGVPAVVSTTGYLPALQAYASYAMPYMNVGAPRPNVGRGGPQPPDHTLY